MGLKTLFKSFIYLVLFVCICTAGSLAALFFLGLENDALIVSTTELSTQNIKRAKQLIDEYRPQKMKEGQEKSLTVSEGDLNLSFYYFLSHIPGGQNISTGVKLEPGTAEIAASVTLPENSFGNYLNILVMLSQTNGKLVLNMVKLGKIEVTGWPARQVLPIALFVLTQTKTYPELIEVVGAVKDYQFRKNQLFLAYEWKSEVAKKLKKKAREMLVPEEERNRLMFYNEHLAKYSKRDNGPKASLSTFLQPIFALAKERTTSTHEPILENRSAITVLALFTLKKPLNLLIGEQNNTKPPMPRKMNLTLRGRHDLAQHFMLSAAIAAIADSDLANIIGLFKELDDSRGGSGFSFDDLAADRAGVRFAEIATTNEGAGRVQEQMSRISSESDFMPDIGRLPVGMQEMEFKKRYNDLDSAAYREVKEEIEQRITACRIFQTR